MLNRVILMGRITHDLELKTTPSGVSALTFSVAVERSYAKQGEERQTDFITCVAWRQQAEFIARYFGKGRMIALEGQLRTRSYEDSSGNKRNVTEVYVDSVSFTGEKKQEQSADRSDEYDELNRNATGYERPPKQEKTYEAPIDLDGLEVLSDDGVPF